MTAYKQTEVGLIPSDWEIKSMSNICDVRDGTHDSPKYLESGIPLITSKNIVNGKLDFSDISFISLFDAEEINKRSKVDKGDILMSMIGTIGNAVLVENQDIFCIKNVALFKPYHEKINNNFLVQFISSDIFKKILENTLDGGIQKFISLGNLRNIVISIPKSTTEQTAIATALSDTDALLAELEKLLAKKQAIKTATMQQLLTGKTRLPEFAYRADGTPKGSLKTEWGDIPEDWEVVELGNLCNIQKGELITSDTKKSGSIPVIAGGKKPAYFHNMANRNGKTITISASGASSGFVNFFTQPIFASDCSTISESEKYNIEFIYYSLVNFQMKIYGMQTGGAQPHVQPSDLKPLLIPITNKPEQTAIAQILSDMDSEIAALQARIEKMREIKQGMMQNLLTGKIRLPF